MGDKINFNLCIPVEVLIEFISKNTEYDWNKTCEREYTYRKSRDFENDRAYPIIILGEDDESTFHYWCEAFVKKHKEEIGSKTVYILHD